jgi:hypothetical protein
VEHRKGGGIKRPQPVERRPLPRTARQSVERALADPFAQQPHRILGVIEQPRRPRVGIRENLECPDLVPRAGLALTADGRLDRGEVDLDADLAVTSGATGQDQMDPRRDGRADLG